MRLAGPQSRYGRHGEEKKSPLCPYWESNSGHPDRSPVTVLTDLVDYFRILLSFNALNHQINSGQTIVWYCA